MNIELSVIIPVLNEQPNIEPLLARLETALVGVAWEVIFVDDDSCDGTLTTVREIARTDERVHGLRRVGRRGLSSACIEGLCASSAPWLAVMDADLQHDETILPLMLAALREGRAEVAIGSRYIAGGGTGQWGATRRWLSRLATWPAQRLCRVTVSDPMSGFFMLKREVFDALVPRLTGVGFKILLDILMSAWQPLTVTEIPYTFRCRHAGTSKLDARVAMDYGVLLLDKTVGRWLPLRFCLYTLVGCVGAVLHLLLLDVMLTLGVRFAWAQLAASGAAMVLNYFFNNTFTFSEWRRRKWAWWTGLLWFVAVCSVGLSCNVQVADWLHERQVAWWLAGLAGAGVSTVWNFAVSSQFVWRPHRGKAKNAAESEKKSCPNPRP